VPKGDLLRHGRVEVDLPCFEVRVDGQKVDLTVTEFRVLHALLERPGRVLTRSQLIDRARAEDYHITERTIDTHIRRIRAKLRPFGVDPIATVVGLGYKASDPE
jgi:two-component system OmpR family response regulator